MILVITGSRNYKSRSIIANALDTVMEEFSIEFMFSGHCERGADRLCELWAYSRAVQPILMPALWGSENGLAAGFARNSLMLTMAKIYANAAKTDLRLIAFPSKCVKFNCRIKNKHWSHGTEDCWDTAISLGIKGKYFADETLA